MLILLGVMRPALRHHDLAGFGLVDDSVHLVDPAAPPALVIALQRLGLADAVKGAALDVSDEGVDPPQGLSVLALPVEIVLPGLGEKQQIKHPPPSSPAPPRTF